MSINNLPQAFRPVEDSIFYDWVENSCHGSLESLSRYVPPVFKSYVHICPPAWQYPENFILPSHPDYNYEVALAQTKQMIPTRWSAVAKANSLKFDGKACWGEIGPEIDYSHPKPGDISYPLEGTTTIEAVNAVENAIATVTAPEDTCIFAIWDGFDVMCLEQAYLSKTLIRRMSQPAHWVLQAPRAILFDYWRTTVDDRDYINPSWTPQAVWCPKQQWFYAVPFARLASFFGGSKAMAKILLETEEIESYPLPEGHIFKY